MWRFFVLLLTIAPELSFGDEVDRFFDDLIQEQEREVKELKRLRNEFQGRDPGAKKSLWNKVEETRDSLRRDFQTFRNTIDDKLHPQRVARLEVRENTDSYDISLVTAGFPSRELDVAIRGYDVIVFRKVDEKRLTPEASEYRSQEFLQEIHLNHRPDPTSAKIEYKKGQLKIHVNKA